MHPIGYYLDTNNTLRYFVEQNLVEIDEMRNPTVRSISWIGLE